MSEPPLGDSGTRTGSKVIGEKARAGDSVSRFCCEAGRPLWSKVITIAQGLGALTLAVAAANGAGELQAAIVYRAFTVPEDSAWNECH